jgi:hypothetical protein
MARVLTSPVRVMHQARRRQAAKPGHGQCISHDFSCHAPLQRPSNDLAVKQVQNDGQVQPAFIRPQIRVSDVQTSFGALGLKLRSNKFCATGRLCLESVVALKRRLCLARTLFSRINRSTRALLAEIPRLRNSLSMRGLP